MTTDPKAATHGGDSARPGGAANAGARRPSPAGSQTRTAFTLIEVMVAVSIMAILVVIMSAIFHQSSVAWDSGTGRMKANVTARAVLNLMEGELSHAVTDSRMKMNIGLMTKEPGSPTIWFWALTGEADTTNRMLRKISYVRSGDAILRKLWKVDAKTAYSNAIDGTAGAAPDHEAVLATNVQEVYFQGWPGDESFETRSSLPGGVKIRLAIGRADRVSNLAAWSAGPDGMTNPDKPKGKDENADDIGSW